MHARTLGAAIALAVTAVTANAQTPSWTVPPESARCPSKWGAGDERGSANLMKPALVLDAVKLIKSGEIIELAHVLGPTMPFFGTRRFDVHVKRTFMNTGSNERGSNEEMVLSEIGQVGTQFDGFAHQTHRNSHYNCFKTEEIAGRGLFNKLGIQNAGAFITRGVLIDVAGFKGVEMLGDNYEVTVEDLEGALKKQNMTLQRGRRRDRQHRLGQDLRQGERALCEVVPRPRREGGAMDHRQEPDPARRRQLAGGSRRPIPIRSCHCRCISSRWW